MNLLFIKLKHIGDALLMTPALTAARASYPDAKIWVLVRKGSESILAGCPAIDRVLTSAAPEKKTRRLSDWLDDIRLIHTLRKQNFDYAFELSDGDRGKFIAILSGAKQRCLNKAYGKLKSVWAPFFFTSKFPWYDRHSVEKDYYTVNDLLPLPAPIPRLTFERASTIPWEPTKNLTNFAILHPATRWMRKRWPVENWISLAKWLLQRVPFLVISVGPQPDEILLAAQIQSAVGPQALSTEGKLSWAQLGDLLYRANLMVAVDTGALHLAAACGCPIVGLYIPGMVVNWRPWMTSYRTVSDPLYLPIGRQTPRTNIQHQTVSPIRVSDVIKACEELLEGSPGDQVAES
jgi:heptosyltransferase-3